MENTVKERIIRYLKYYGITQRSFCEKIGAASNYISCMRVSISAEKLKKIKSSYPDLNITWLLTGEGEMLKSSGVDSTEIDSYEMQRAVSYNQGVPYYDVDFLLGFDELETPATQAPEYLINIPRYNNATLWCNASGDSMNPEICNGDIVALQRVEDFRFLPFDNVYAFITTNDMRTIKRIGRGSTPQSYRLIPTNKDYEEQDLPFEMIRQVYKVVGCLKQY